MEAEVDIRIGSREWKDPDSLDEQPEIQTLQAGVLIRMDYDRACSLRNALDLVALPLGQHLERNCLASLRSVLEKALQDAGVWNGEQRELKVKL